MLYDERCLQIAPTFRPDDLRSPECYPKLAAAKNFVSEVIQVSENTLPVRNPRLQLAFGLRLHGHDRSFGMPRAPGKQSLFQAAGITWWRIWMIASPSTIIGSTRGTSIGLWRSLLKGIVKRRHPSKIAGKQSRFAAIRPSARSLPFVPGFRHPAR